MSEIERYRLDRRRFLGASFTAFAGLAAFACTPPAAAPPTVAPTAVGASGAATSAEWDALLADARREGQVILAAGGSTSLFEPIFQNFTDKYGVEIVLTTGSGPDQVDRILAERTRGVYDMDIIKFGGTASARMVDAGTVLPAKPLYLLPDLSDRSQNWFGEKDIWLDSARQNEPAYLLRTDRNLTDVYYNTNKVSKAEIDSVQSYQDFLKPQWKGRIGTYLEPSFMGPTTPRTWMWLKLGPDWFGHFTTDQDVTFLGNDFRGQADSLIRGAFDVLMMTDLTVRTQINDAIAAGLPVASLDRTLQEGRISISDGDVMVMDKATHPRAAQLFFNWTLSQEGQTAYQGLTLDPDPVPSLRNDVPQGKVTDANWALRQATKPEELLDPTDPAYLKTIDDAMTWLKQMSTEHHIYGF